MWRKKENTNHPKDRPSLGLCAPFPHGVQPATPMRSPAGRTRFEPLLQILRQGYNLVYRGPIQQFSEGGGNLRSQAHSARTVRDRRGNDQAEMTRKRRRLEPSADGGCIIYPSGPSGGSA